MSSDKLRRLLGGQPFHAWPLGHDYSRLTGNGTFGGRRKNPGRCNSWRSGWYRYPRDLALPRRVLTQT